MNISNIVLVLAFALTLACSSDWGSTRSENAVTLEQNSHTPWLPWF